MSPKTWDAMMEVLQPLPIGRKPWPVFAREAAIVADRLVAEGVEEARQQALTEALELTSNAPSVAVVAYGIRRLLAALAGSGLTPHPAEDDSYVWERPHRFKDNGGDTCRWCGHESAHELHDLALSSPPEPTP